MTMTEALCKPCDEAADVARNRRKMELKGARRKANHSARQIKKQRLCGCSLNESLGKRIIKETQFFFLVAPHVSASPGNKCCSRGSGSKSLTVGHVFHLRAEFRNSLTTGQARELTESRFYELSRSPACAVNITKKHFEAA